MTGAKRMPKNVPPYMLPAYWGHELAAHVVDQTARQTLVAKDAELSARARWNALPEMAKRRIGAIVGLLLDMPTLQHMAVYRYTTMTHQNHKSRTGKKRKSRP